MKTVTDFLQVVLKQSHQALKKNEIPVGAIIYDPKKMILISQAHYGSLRDSSYGEKPFLIKVKVQKQLIDFYESIKNNILYPNEEEVTLKNKGFGADIIEITPINL